MKSIETGLYRGGVSGMGSQTLKEKFVVMALKASAREWLGSGEYWAYFRGKMHSG